MEVDPPCLKTGKIWKTIHLGKRNIAGDQRSHDGGQLRKRWKIGDGLGHGTADVSRQAETEVLGEDLMFLRNEED